jgi:hypothetical protein
MGTHAFPRFGGTSYGGAMPPFALRSLRLRPFVGPPGGRLGVEQWLASARQGRGNGGADHLATPLTSTGIPPDLVELSKASQQGPVRLNQRWQPLMIAAVLDIVA